MLRIHGIVALIIERGFTNRAQIGKIENLGLVNLVNPARNGHEFIDLKREIFFHRQRAAAAGDRIGHGRMFGTSGFEPGKILVFIFIWHNRWHTSGESTARLSLRLLADEAASQEKTNCPAHNKQAEGHQNTCSHAKWRGSSRDHQIKLHSQHEAFEQRRADRQTAQTKQRGEPDADHRREQRMAADRQ